MVSRPDEKVFIYAGSDSAGRRAVVLRMCALEAAAVNASCEMRRYWTEHKKTKSEFLAFAAAKGASPEEAESWYEEIVGQAKPIDPRTEEGKKRYKSLIEPWLGEIEAGLQTHVEPPARQYTCSAKFYSYDSVYPGAWESRWWLRDETDSETGTDKKALKEKVCQACRKIQAEIGGRFTFGSARKCEYTCTGGDSSTFNKPCSPQDVFR